MEHGVPPGFQAKASHLGSHHWAMEANELFLQVMAVIVRLEQLMSGITWEAVEERMFFLSGIGQPGRKTGKDFQLRHYLQILCPPGELGYVLFQPTEGSAGSFPLKGDLHLVLPSMSSNTVSAWCHDTECPQIGEKWYMHV